MSVLNIKWRRDWFQLGSKVERFISGSWIPWPLLCLFKNSRCCQVRISTGIVPAHSNLWTVSSHCVGDWLGQTSVWKMLLISCMGTWKNSAQAHGLLLFNLPAQTWLYCSHFSGFLFLVFTFSWQTHRVFCCISKHRHSHTSVQRSPKKVLYWEADLRNMKSCRTPHAWQLPLWLTTKVFSCTQDLFPQMKASLDNRLYDISHINSWLPCVYVDT